MLLNSQIDQEPLEKHPGSVGIIHVDETEKDILINLYLNENISNTEESCERLQRLLITEILGLHSNFFKGLQEYLKWIYSL